MSDEHAKDFFGGRPPLKDDLMKPILHPTDNTKASQIKSFYEDYGIAYLCNGLVTYPPKGALHGVELQPCVQECRFGKCVIAFAKLNAGEEKYTDKIDRQKVNDYLQKMVPTKEQYKDQTASIYLVAFQEARPRSGMKYLSL